MKSHVILFIGGSMKNVNPKNHKLFLNCSDGTWYGGVLRNDGLYPGRFNGAYKRLTSKFSIISNFLSFLAATALLLLCGPQEAVAGGRGHSAVNCLIQDGPCTLKIGDLGVTLQILPRPVKAMRDLTFKVTMEGGYDRGQPYIDLNMPAMNMGRNRVLLKPDGSGGFEGRGIIVRCRSGDATWGAAVTFPGVGSTEFIFDVVY